MRSAWGFIIILFSLLSSVFTSGCKGCGSDPFAELVAAHGEVTRDFNDSLEQWKPAAPGSEFEIGEALRTAPAAAADVRFDDGATLKLEESTTVRFLDVKPDSGERGINVETGEAVLETTDKMRLRTGIGLAVIEGGSVLRLTRTDRGMNFLVSVGLARLQGSDGSVTEVNAGEGFEVGIGMAILDELEEPEPTATATTESQPDAAPLSGIITAQIEGPGALIQKPGSKKFTPIPEGENEIPPGSRLRLNRKNRAMIERGGQRATLAGPGTYTIGGEGLDFVRPEMGSTLLSADGKDVTLEVPGGEITALGSQGPAAGDVKVGRGGQVEVRVRRGKFKADVNGNQALLSAGEGLSADKKSFSITGRNLGFADITTAAGGGLMIHDPDPPSAVGVNVGEKCDHLGILERLERKRVVASAVSESLPSLRFPKGRNAYRVRCLSDEGELSEPVASGTVVVYHDAGTAALAKRPPATAVKVDGRSYTVLYQNRLPAITVRWPNAPKAPTYVIHVTSPRGGDKITTGLPAHTFQSGTLYEGKHRFQFRASNGRVSRTSAVAIRFDNAAPKASIKAPASGSFSPGSQVRVAGIALPGWRVSAGGTRLPMDAQRRFSGQVTAGRRGIVLRFEHEHRGVHHYLRRASGITR